MEDWRADGWTDGQTNHIDRQLERQRSAGREVDRVRWADRHAETETEGLGVGLLVVSFNLVFSIHHLNF